MYTVSDNAVLLCRLEAEMAAMDVGELLHQKAAAEAAAHTGATRNAQLEHELAQVGHTQH